MYYSDFNDIPAGMLSSPQIKELIRAGWLVRVPEGKANDTNEYIKSSTYDMRLGDWVGYFENGERKVRKLGTYERLDLKPNSLVFVTTYESFYLPCDIIARFNLKTRHIHRGLLLGTGPIIDPEFKGTILIPIHNLSSQTIHIKYLESIISVEFTKTLDASGTEYINNTKCNGDAREYFNNLDITESSLLQTLKDAHELNNKIKDAIKDMRSIDYTVGFAIIIAILSLFYSITSMINDVNERIDQVHSIYTKK